MKYEKELAQIKYLLTHSTGQKVQRVVEYLYDQFNTYSWVGVYLLKEKNLILGPWKGLHATEHTIIPIGKGICGAAALSGKTELVQEVSKDQRYLACFTSTRSEIVVPIRKNHAIIGEIDIDSDTSNAFDEHDKEFLEKIADMLSQHI